VNLTPSIPDIALVFLLGEGADSSCHAVRKKKLVNIPK